MADLGFGDSGFDAAAPENQRRLVPAGKYKAIMIKSEKKATSAGDGFYLKTQWQIVAGEFQNRMIFKNFNLWLPASKQEALQIARGEFSECCRAVGVTNPKDSSELHDKPCIIDVKIRKDKTGEYGDQNDISKFTAVNAVAQVQQPVAAASGHNPW